MLDPRGNLEFLRGMIDGHGSTSAHARTRGVVIGVSLCVLIGVAIFPFRDVDYELEFLLVLPVVFVGVLAGRTAALVTAAVAVLTFHAVTQFGDEKLEEDLIASVTFLGSALAVGTAVGGGADRLTLAHRREEEQRQMQELNAQMAENSSRMAVLQQVDEQRVALLRSVSHDLRTPLATIRAVATDLRDRDLHDERTRQELLKSVSDEAERLDRLVGNLLSMSRIEAGSLKIDHQAVDLTELLQLTVLRLGTGLLSSCGRGSDRTGPAADRRRPGTAGRSHLQPSRERSTPRSRRLDRLDGSGGDQASHGHAACERSWSRY